MDFSRTVVSTVLPDGYAVYTGAVTDGRVERNPGVEWTFGRVDERGEVLPAIRLTIAPAEGGSACPARVKRSPSATPAPLCLTDSNDVQLPLTAVSWLTDDGVDLNVVADATVNADELLAFASALDSETIGSAVTRDPVYDPELAARQTPPGWELLADDALLSTYGAREVSFIVGPENAPCGALDCIQVRTSTGAPPTAR